jgi:hypothetical protein
MFPHALPGDFATVAQLGENANVPRCRNGDGVIPARPFKVFRPTRSIAPATRKRPHKIIQRQRCRKTRNEGARCKRR